jgi:hypothetical protein
MYDMMWQITTHASLDGMLGSGHDVLRHMTFYVDAGSESSAGVARTGGSHEAEGGGGCDLCVHSGARSGDK